MGFLKDVIRWKKPTRTISGVTPLAVMLPPRKCKHGACLYCPSLNAPQSYTPKSPAVIRAASLKYDPFKQTATRLESFRMMKHPTDKIELIIMGGTFLSYPPKFQQNFIKRCYDALNSRVSKTLEEAKKINEHAKHRCIALCIETRPDICGKKEIERILEFGATRVELGVQAIDDKIYKIVNRGHSVKDVIKATRLLKDAGFKVGYHMMPGLPGSNPKKDLEMFNRLFSDSDFKPDQIKIYPTQVICGSNLEKWFEAGKYAPYDDKTMIELVTKMKETIPEYCRIMRVMREIPREYMTSGTAHIDLRKTIKEKMNREGKRCKCIRCREIGFVQRDSKAKIDDKLKLKKMEYQASNEKEIFIQIVNKDNVLFGLCRLRKVGSVLFVRELHVYGPQALIGGIGKVQHKGLGALLMQETESIARKERSKKITVISGVGVREYYRKLGYRLENNYMIKKVILK